MKNDPKQYSNAVKALDVPPRTKRSNYPEQFQAKVAGREKRQLGEFFELKNFGVNLTTLKPGAQSALLHYHTKQDEFIYVLEGEITLVTDDGETLLTPGMCAGFAANGTPHCLVNKSDKDAVYLEVGDRTPGDEARYPADDLKAVLDADGKWVFTHKDGTPYL